ncbi:MAG: hypothetical protein JKY89_01250 [Immundisolibacteraceae bacterium]|nr:hypothetical protein [Immundisolibacteraceae bacterium]
MKLLISIQPKHANKIFSGEKLFEFRKKIPIYKIKTALVYSSYPTKMIIGEFEIEETLTFTPEELWIKTGHKSGITKEFFNEYFKNTSISHALKIKNPILYNKPKKLSEFGLKRPPQSFMYLRS